MATLRGPPRQVRDDAPRLRHDPGSDLDVRGQREWCCRPARDGDEPEGYVVRLAGAFTYGAFRRAAAYYVRAGHDQTRAPWWQGQQVVRNELASDLE
jgi:hypothetical protein